MNNNVQITADIPGRLLLSRACFHLSAVAQSYPLKTGIDRAKEVVLQKISHLKNRKMSKEKKKQKKKRTMEWATAHHLVIRFYEASVSRHILHK